MGSSRFFSFWVYPPVGILLLGVGLQTESNRSRFALIGLFLLGTLLWTLLEYGLHRFVFHWEPDSPRLKRLIFDLHAVHHRDPRDPAKLLVRPRFSLAASTLLFGAAYLILGVFSQAVAILAGIWSGFPVGRPACSVRRPVVLLPGSLTRPPEQSRWFRGAPVSN